MNYTTEGDGVALTSVAHPRPVWWKRPYYWLRCLGGIKRSALVDTTITVSKSKDPKP